jgi:hypothetical protein
MELRTASSAFSEKCGIASPWNKSEQELLRCLAGVLSSHAIMEKRSGLKSSETSHKTSKNLDIYSSAYN